MMNSKFYREMAMYTMAGLTTVAIMKGAEIAYDKIKAAISAKENSNVDDDSEKESDEDTFEFDVKGFEESEESDGSEDSENFDQESDKEILDLTVEEYLDELMGILHDSTHNEPSRFTRKILRDFYEVSENKSFFLTGYEAASASMYFNERYDKDSIGVVLLVIGKYMQDFIIAYSLHSGVPGGHIIDSFNNRIEDAVKEMKEKKNNEEK